MTAFITIRLLGGTCFRASDRQYYAATTKHGPPKAHIRESTLYLFLEGRASARPTDNIIRPRQSVALQDLSLAVGITYHINL